jgi:hypothetical protein
MENIAIKNRIQVSANAIDTSRTATIQGIEVETFVSPYDLPEEVIGGIENNRFVVEFKYLNDEPTETTNVGNNVNYSLGKFSHRLYEIQIDANEVNQAIREAISVIDNLLKKESDNDNYELTKEIIEKNKAEIFSSQENLVNQTT